MIMTTTTKKILVARLIELYIKNNVDIVSIIGVPLKRFDFEKIERILEDSILEFEDWEKKHYNIKYISK